MFQYFLTRCSLDLWVSSYESYGLRRDISTGLDLLLGAGDIL